MKNTKTLKAFSLIELSIVILIIGVLVAAIVKGQNLFKSIQISTARSVTNSSSVNSITGLKLWLEPVMEKSVTSTSIASGGDTADYGALTAGSGSWNDIRVTVNTNKINLTAAGTVTYVEDGISGLPSLSFNGTNSAFTSTSAPLLAKDSTYSIAVVWRANTGGGSGGTLFSQGGTGTNSLADITLVASGLEFNSGANKTSSGVAVATNSAYVTIVTVNNDNTSNVTIYNNSNTGVNTPTTDGLTNDNTTLSLGSNNVAIGKSLITTPAQYFFSGLVSEVIVFDKVLSSSEIAEVSSYLGQKYSIKIN